MGGCSPCDASLYKTLFENLSKTPYRRAGSQGCAEELPEDLVLGRARMLRFDPAPQRAPGGTLDPVRFVSVSAERMVF
jgi:hypothetical protein